MFGLDNLVTYESLLSKTDEVLVYMSDFDNLKNLYNTGMILLDVDIPVFFEQTVKESFSVMFNELGLKCDGVSKIVLVTKDDKISDESLKSFIEKNKLKVIYDFTNTIQDTLYPRGSFSHRPRHSFATDTGLNWRYEGDTSKLDPIRVKAFHSAFNATFFLSLLQEIVGQEVAKVISSHKDDSYERVKELFDGMLVGIVDFPIEKDVMDDLCDYLNFLNNHPKMHPRPGTFSTNIITYPKEMKEQAGKLFDMTALVRDAYKVWNDCLRSSGSGLTNSHSFSDSLMDSQKHPINVDTRKAIAEITGVASTLDALISGVPLDDILA